MKVSIQYFAQLRELRGLAREEHTTAARTAAELFDELNSQHGFGMDRAHLRVALNDEFVDWQNSLSENDQIVFIPPVAGG